MKSSILQKSFDLKDYIIAAKRQIHIKPELSMSEFETTAFVKSELTKIGIDMVPLDSDVGVLGLIQGEKKGKEIVTALRADMDALPIQETTDLVDKSIVPGVMHACGHDCHTAMLLGAARILVSMKDQFSGTIKLIFQPAEENLFGSQHMIEQGVLKNPNVDYIMGMHGHSGYQLGQIALREGSSMASSDFFNVKITGTSGHGAYPHRVGCDPILAASNSVMALQSIITRQIDALDNVVISICTIHGGTAKNIIPETVEFSGSVRCQNKEIRKTIEGKIKKIINGVSSSFNCKSELNYHYGVPALINSPEVTKALWKSAEKIVGADNVRYIDIPAMGSEDFSRYLEVVPKGVFARLGIQEPNKPEILFHNGNFVFPEAALPYGTALLAQFIIDTNQ